MLFARAPALALAILPVLIGATGALADPANPDWPCIQRKVVTLSAAQMWDGPAVDELAGWREDPEIRALIPVLVSRRIRIEAASADVAAFAGRQPEQDRDQRLKLLFAGVLATINADRAVVIRGIERLQRRQRALAEQIEREGTALAAFRQAAAKDEAGGTALKEAEERFAWDTRIFGERQQTIPTACEVPVAIESRAFDLGRAIRAEMRE